MLEDINSGQRDDISTKSKGFFVVYESSKHSFVTMQMKIYFLFFMCKICSRHRWPWPSIPLCCQLSWSAGWGFFSWLCTSSDCLCDLCAVFLCFSFHIFYHIIVVFSSPSALTMFPKNFNCLTLMIFRRDLLYLAISITFSFVFLSAHDTLIMLLMDHISTASSLLSRSFGSVQHSHSYRRIGHT